MRLSYSFYRPSALGHRPACCAFLAFFSRKKKNQPSLFHDPDCKFDKLNHNIQSIFFNSLLVPQLFKKKKSNLTFIINDFFLSNLKLKKIKSHFLLSTICFCCFNSMSLSFIKKKCFIRKYHICFIIM